MKKGLKLFTKTQMSIGVIIGVVMVMTITLAYASSYVRRDLIDVKEKQLEATFDSLQLSEQIGDMQLSVEQYLAGDAKKIEIYEAAHKDYQKLMGRFGSVAKNSPIYTDVKLIKDNVNVYHQKVGEIFNLYNPLEEVKAKEKINKILEEDIKELCALIEASGGNTYGFVAPVVNIVSELQAYVNGKENVKEAFEINIAALSAIYGQGEISECIARIEREANEAFKQYNPIYKAKAQVMQKEMYTANYAILKSAIDRVAKSDMRETKDHLDNIIRTIGFIDLSAVVSIVIVIILGIISSVIMRLMVIKPIVKVGKVLENISEGEGDLTVHIPVNSGDEISKMSSYFNLFVKKIHTIIEKVIGHTTVLFSHSETMNVAVREANEAMNNIGVSIQTITSVLQENASVVEETAASIEEIASSANIVSEKAEEVVEVSKDVLHAAENGAMKLTVVKDVFEEVKGSSKAIKENIETLTLHSKDIGEVVNIITGISDQVNLLSLNASIEAARAGEHGLGFAVVADEIRKLAEESRKSAVNIETLLDEIVDKTNQVSDSVEKEQLHIEESSNHMIETEIAFQNILKRVNDVVQMMAHIADVIASQSDATEGISKAINEMSVSTQESSEAISHINTNVSKQVTTFEEIKATIEAFDTLFRELVEETSKFKV